MDAKILGYNFFMQFSGNTTKYNFLAFVIKTVIVISYVIIFTK